MFNHHHAKEANFNVDGPIAYAGLPLQSLIAADVSWRKILQKKLAKVRSKMLPTVFVYASSTEFPLRFTALKKGGNGTSNIHGATDRPQPRLAQFQLSTAFSLNPFRNFANWAVA
jgi:hypothetical protein